LSYSASVDSLRAFGNFYSCRAITMRLKSRDEFVLRAMLTDAWSAATVRRVRSAVRRAGVIVHDPDAQKPQNLDNPFRDQGVQKRIGEFIARASARNAKA
jgi:hypothetical protein